MQHTAIIQASVSNMNKFTEAAKQVLNTHANTFERLAASEAQDKVNQVLQETLQYLESYEQSPFDSNAEMAAYIRAELGMQRPAEPETAEDLLREFLTCTTNDCRLSNIKQRAQCLLDGVPTPQSVDSILMSGVTLKGTARIIDVAGQYTNGQSLEQIAQNLNVTRERIRQMLAKFVRQNATGGTR